MGWRAWAWGRGLGDRPSGRHRNQAEGHSQLKEGGVERRSLGCVCRVMSMGLGGYEHGPRWVMCLGWGSYRGTCSAAWDVDRLVDDICLIARHA